MTRDPHRGRAPVATGLKIALAWPPLLALAYVMAVLFGARYGIKVGLGVGAVIATLQTAVCLIGLRPTGGWR